MPLKEALHAAGCSLSEGRLTNQPNLQKAISILVIHLQQTTYPPDIREYRADALNFPEVKPYWDLLLQLYRAERQARKNQTQH